MYVGYIHVSGKSGLGRMSSLQSSDLKCTEVKTQSKSGDYVHVFVERYSNTDIINFIVSIYNRKNCCI